MKGAEVGRPFEVGAVRVMRMPRFVLMAVCCLVAGEAAAAGKTTGDARRGCEAFVLDATARGVYKKLNALYRQKSKLHELKRLIESGERSETFLLNNGLDERHMAAIAGDEERFLELMERTPEVTGRDRYGRTLLHYAALGGSRRAAAHLIASGVDIDAVDWFGQDSLAFAAAGGSVPVLELLLKNGLSIRRNGNSGRALLFSAAEGGALEVVRFLHGKGVPLDDTTADGRTIYHRVDLGASALMSWLLDRSVGLDDGRHREVLVRRTAQSDDPEIIDRISRAAASKIPGWYQALLKEAVADRRGRTIEYLMDRGIAPGDRQLERVAVEMSPYPFEDDLAWKEALYRSVLRKMVAAGATPSRVGLNAVARAGHFGLARLFLEHGAGVDSTTLALLAASGDRSLLDVAISRGIAPDDETLLGAASSGNLRLFRYLEDRFGLAVDARSRKSRTGMLQRSIEGNTPALVEYLLNRGVAPSPTRDAYKRNDLHTLLSVCNQEIIDLMMPRFNLFLDGAFRDTQTYFIAAERCTPGMARLLMVTRGPEDIRKLVDATRRVSRKRLGVFFRRILDHPDIWGEELFRLAQHGALAVAVFDDDDARIGELIAAYPTLDHAPTGGELLHLAVRKESYPAVCYLLANGVDVNARTADGETALMAAIEAGDLRFVRYLLDNGADVAARSRYSSPAGEAARHGDLAVLRLLAERGVDLDDREAVNGLFFEAAWRGHLEVVKYLVDQKGADVNTTRNGQSFVSYSSQLFNEESRLRETVAYALNRGLDLNAPKGEPVVHALINEYAERPEQTLALLDYFTQRGARVNARDNKKRTPIFTAVSQCFAREDRFEALIDYLVKRGARLDAAGERGESILTAAESLRCPERSLRLLKRKGARYNGVDRVNREAAAVFEDAKNGAEDTAESLRRLKRLIGKRGKHLNVVNQEGRTLLHLACRSERIALVKYLVNRGASITSEDEWGNTPLSLALSDSESIEMARFLVENGARFPDTLDGANRMVLDALSDGRMDIVGYLEKNGVVLRESEHERDRASQLEGLSRRLQGTVRFGYFEASVTIIRFLLDHGYSHSDIEKPLAYSLREFIREAVARCNKPNLAGAAEFAAKLEEMKLSSPDIPQEADCAERPR